MESQRGMWHQPFCLTICNVCVRTSTQQCLKIHKQSSVIMFDDYSISSTNNRKLISKNMLAQRASIHFSSEARKNNTGITMLVFYSNACIYNYKCILYNYACRLDNYAICMYIITKHVYYYSVQCAVQDYENSSTKVIHY